MLTKVKGTHVSEGTVLRQCRLKKAYMGHQTEKKNSSSDAKLLFTDK